MNRARITILSNDIAGGRHLLAEHGLALWVEWGALRLLFDTGQGLVLGHNAAELGIALEETDAILLSHGHYDHTGGLHGLPSTTGSTRVYAHPAALTERYAGGGETPTRDIGMRPSDRSALARLGPLVETTGPTEVGQGLFLTGPIPRETTYEDSGGTFSTDPGGRAPDPFADDQAAFFETENGVTVLLGCAHAGVVNTLRYVRRLTGDRPLDLVLGGMHLLSASEERLERTIEALRALGPRRLVPIHCTGLGATARLLAALPEQCDVGHTGSVFIRG